MLPSITINEILYKLEKSQIAWDKIPKFIFWSLTGSEVVVKLVDNICFYVCFKYYYKSVHNNYFSPSGGENSDNLTDQDTVTESHQEIQEEIQKESSKESNEKSKEQSQEESHLESQEKSQDESHEVVNSVPPQDNLETTSLQPTTTKMSQYQELPRSSDNEGRNHQDLQVLLNILFFSLRKNYAS